MATITYEHVTKRFDDTIAVDDLSIDVADGEFLVLVRSVGLWQDDCLAHARRARGRDRWADPDR